MIQPAFSSLDFPPAPPPSQADGGWGRGSFLSSEIHAPVQRMEELQLGTQSIKDAPSLPRPLRLPFPCLSFLCPSVSVSVSHQSLKYTHSQSALYPALEQPPPFPSPHPTSLLPASLLLNQRDLPPSGSEASACLCARSI